MELCNSPFFRILRAGLWNAPLTEQETAGLGEQELVYVAQLARAHAVCAVVADGSAAMSELLADYVDRTEKGNRLVDRVAEVMAGFWEAKGIKAVLLKGQGIAAMYPNPLHRTPGDIDWYFPGEANFRQALKLAESRGAVTEEDGEADYHYAVSGVVVEHHRRWCDLSNPLKQRRITELEEMCGYAAASGHNELSPVLFLVQQNAHILKHLLIKGIGWRQLCDLAVVYAHFYGSYDAAEYERAIKKMGMYRWARLLGGVLVTYLGLDAEKMPLSPAAGRDVHRLAEMVTACGNFGSLHNRGMLVAWLAKAGFFIRYAPGELFWRPAELAVNRMRQKLKRNI